MKKTLVIAVVALATFAVKAQTNVPANHTEFFSGVMSYFSSFNTNYDGILTLHKGTLWAGANFQGGAHNSSSLGLEYKFWKQFSLDSETRFADVSGTIHEQQLGVGYNVEIHDVRITGYAAGLRNFDEDKFKAVLGIRVKKLMTQHTFTFLGLAVPLEKDSRPRIEVGTGFVF